MKKNKSAKEKIISQLIILIVSMSILLVIGIVIKNYAMLIVLGIISLFIGLLMIDSYISRSKFIKEQNSLKQHYESIKQKEIKTVFDECYILSYEDLLDSSLFSAFKKNKVDGIRSITTDIVDENSTMICCQYNSFEINIHVYKDRIDYRIFPPSRFDIIKSTKTFIEKRTAKIPSAKCHDIDSFLYQLSTLMRDIKDIIDNFIASNKVDNIFNGRLLHKFDYYFSNAKVESICGIIAGPFLFIMMIYIFVSAFLPDKEYQTENPVGFWIAVIFMMLFMVLSVYVFAISVIELSRKHKFEKDFEARKYCKISGKPTKVKINVEIPKIGNMYIKSMILFFGKTKLFLPLEPRNIDNLKIIKKCKAECMKMYSNIKYLETSKIIFEGANAYINIINRYSSNGSKFI
jgi:hypothetical protein